MVKTKRQEDHRVILRSNKKLLNSMVNGDEATMTPVVTLVGGWRGASAVEWPEFRKVLEEIALLAAQRAPGCKARSWTWTTRCRTTISWPAWRTCMFKYCTRVQEHPRAGTVGGENP